ncbi:MAG TPA: hypothetical protein VE973_04050, partial [Candidatus Limnocylindria bacterium]|nr:hypothetical protein [Candidatus Limnocylindria bacterium]
MHRIYIQSAITDARAKVKKSSFGSLGLKNKIGVVCLAESYAIDSKLNSKQLEKAKSLLANPLTQNAFVGRPNIKKFSYSIEIGFLPGVTDNVGHTTKETLTDGAKIKFKPGQNVYASQVFFVYFNKNNNSKQSAEASAKADISKIANSLYNPLIQRASITSFADFQKAGLDSSIPKVKIKSSNKVLKVNLN